MSVVSMLSVVTMVTVGGSRRGQRDGHQMRGRTSRAYGVVLCGIRMGMPALESGKGSVCVQLIVPSAVRVVLVLVVVMLLLLVRMMVMIRHMVEWSDRRMRICIVGRRNRRELIRWWGSGSAVAAATIVVVVRSSSSTAATAAVAVVESSACKRPAFMGELFRTRTRMGSLEQSALVA